MKQKDYTSEIAKLRAEKEKLLADNKRHSEMNAELKELKTLRAETRALREDGTVKGGIRKALNKGKDYAVEFGKNTAAEMQANAKKPKPQARQPQQQQQSGFGGDGFDNQNSKQQSGFGGGNVGGGLFGGNGGGMGFGGNIDTLNARPSKGKKKKNNDERQSFFM